MAETSWLQFSPRSDLIEIERAVLLVLVTIDMALIAIHCISGVTMETIPFFLNIARDFSLAEFFNYLKWATCSALLYMAWRRSGIATYGAMALVLAVITLDDSLQIHERMGALYAGGAARSTGLQDIGELIAFGVMGALLLGPLLWSIWRSGRAGLLAVAGLILLIGVLAAFGIGVDAVHAFVPRFPWSNQLFDLVEDGGEMLVGSLIVAHVWARSRKASH